jgi:hypothetical protein
MTREAAAIFADGVVAGGGIEPQMPFFKENLQFSPNYFNIIFHYLA